MEGPLTLAQQREFFNLAGVWLRCRRDSLDPALPDKVWYFLGEMDYAAEMRLLIAEVRWTFTNGLIKK